MNVLADAHSLTAPDGERRKDYGDCRQAQEKAAAMWSVILGHPVTGAQVALCMIALKITREIQAPKRDNIVDIAGWARVYELTTEEKSERRESLRDVQTCASDHPLQDTQ